MPTYYKLLEFFTMAAGTKALHCFVFFVSFIRAAYVWSGTGIVPCSGSLADCISQCVVTQLHISSTFLIDGEAFVCLILYDIVILA